jgi:hypothetical protein
MEIPPRLPWKTSISIVLLYHGKYITIELQVVPNLLTPVSSRKKSTRFYFWNSSIICRNHINQCHKLFYFLHPCGNQCTFLNVTILIQKLNRPNDTTIVADAMWQEQTGSQHFFFLSLSLFYDQMTLSVSPASPYTEWHYTINITTQLSRFLQWLFGKPKIDGLIRHLSVLLNSHLHGIGQIQLLVAES